MVNNNGLLSHYICHFFTILWERGLRDNFALGFISLQWSSFNILNVSKGCLHPLLFLYCILSLVFSKPHQNHKDFNWRFAWMCTASNKFGSIFWRNDTVYCFSWNTHSSQENKLVVDRVGGKQTIYRSHMVHDLF